MLVERLTAAAAPVPDRLNACGLPLALSATLNDAVRLPLAEGVKVTLTVHPAPTATELPQLLLWAKSPALAPAIARLLIVSAALPLLVRVTAFTALFAPTGWPPKGRLPAEKVAAGVPPIPERPTFCELTELLLAMLRVPLRVPVAEGLKVALIVQLAPAANDRPQLLDWAKLLPLVPVIVMPVMPSAALPVLLSLTLCAELVVPTAWLPKEMLEPERLHTARLFVADMPPQGPVKTASAVMTASSTAFLPAGRSLLAPDGDAARLPAPRF